MNANIISIYYEADYNTDIIIDSYGFIICSK